jgi:hypothetical protein
MPKRDAGPRLHFLTIDGRRQALRQLWLAMTGVAACAIESPKDERV